MNPHVEAAHQKARAWVIRSGIVTGEAALQHFDAARFAWLAARAYPTAPLHELVEAVQWNIWLFQNDDQSDEEEHGQDPERLLARYKRLREVLHGASTNPSDSVSARALEELYGGMAQRASSGWRRRFVKSVEDYLDGCIWEAQNRAARRIPDLASYQGMRLLTGGVYTAVELIELCEQIHLPEEVLACPALQGLTLMTNNAVCWANDILSLQKELANGEVHNLVLVIQQERGCSLQDALDLAAAMHEAEVRAFLALERQMPSFGADIDVALGRHLGILRAWMRGSVDWELASGRYMGSTWAESPWEHSRGDSAFAP